MKKGGVRIVHRGETRVVLLGKRYTPEPVEPVWGSKYECIGTITELLDEVDNYDVRVKWDNGKTNIYEIKDLRAYSSEDTSNPKHNFQVKEKDNRWTKRIQTRLLKDLLMIKRM